MATQWQTKLNEALVVTSSGGYALKVALSNGFTAQTGNVITKLNKAIDGTAQNVRVTTG